MQLKIYMQIWIAPDYRFIYLSVPILVVLQSSLYKKCLIFVCLITVGHDNVSSCDCWCYKVECAVCTVKLDSLVLFTLFYIALEPFQSFFFLHFKLCIV